MSFAATCRPDYEFARALARYQVSPETLGAPRGALEALLGSHGPLSDELEEFGCERTFRPDGAILAKHPTLGWFVACPEAEVRSGVFVVWSELPIELLALACAKGLDTPS